MRRLGSVATVKCVLYLLKSGVLSEVVVSFESS